MNDADYARRLGHMGEAVWEHNGRRIRFGWVGDADYPVTRVYALAFLPDGRMLLVSDTGTDALFWLPGGGIEEGETPDKALVRELQEEAGARLLASRRLGLQSVEDDEGNLEYHAFYWARIELTDDFVPQHEVNVTRHVHPDDFLDTLFWGRSDPKGVMLWEMAREIENSELRSS